MGLKDTFVGLALGAVCVIALLLFLIGIGVDNNAAQRIDGDASVNQYLGNATVQYANVEPDINSSATAFSTSTPIVGTASDIQNPAVSTNWKSILKASYNIYELTIGLLVTKVFGGSGYAFLITGLGATLLGVILLYAWQWWRGQA